MSHLNYQQEIISDELYKRKQTMCAVLCAEKEMHVSVLSLPCMGPRVKKIQIKNQKLLPLTIFLTISSNVIGNPVPTSLIETSPPLPSSYQVFDKSNPAS